MYVTEGMDIGDDDDDNNKLSCVKDKGRIYANQGCSRTWCTVNRLSTSRSSIFLIRSTESPNAPQKKVASNHWCSTHPLLTIREDKRHPEFPGHDFINVIERIFSVDQGV